MTPEKIERFIRDYESSMPRVTVPTFTADEQYELAKAALQAESMRKAVKRFVQRVGPRDPQWIQDSKADFEQALNERKESE